MIDHIVELQIKLQQARNEHPNPKYRMRTAALDDASKLLKSGYDTREVYDILGPSNVSFAQVQAEQARIERQNELRRRYQLRGGLPDDGGYFAILQK